VPGAPFTDYCDKAKLDVRARLDLFVRVCEAIQHAHQRGIVHRDLKPSNVLVADHDGLPAPKVIDFGVARATAEVEAGERATRASEVIGTYAYMSPEQADPEGGVVGPRSDVYSLGVLLYELLTGTLPVDAEDLRGKSPSEVSRLLADTDPPAPSTRLTRLGAASVPYARRRGGLDPRTLARRLSGDLDWITLRAMERDPERRYRTAAELASDVRRHLAHQAVLAGPPGPAYRARKFVRRHQLGVGATAALLLALVSGAAGTALGFREARTEARAALDSERETRLALLQEGQERQRVEQASAMVFKLLDLANPESTWHGDDSAVALLLQLSDEIGEAFEADPEGEARLRLNVGRALRTRGEFDHAREQLLRVQDLETGYGADIASRAETGRELHRLEVDAGGHGDYTAGLAAALATVQALSVEAPMAGQAAGQLLEDAQGRKFGDLKGDLEQLELSLKVGGGAGARARLLAADVAGIAGGYLGLHFAFAEAEPLLSYSLDLRSSVEGPLHPEVVRGLGELVEHLLQQGQSRSAARLIDERLALAGASLPAGNWLTAELESRLGECRSLEGDVDDAGKLLAEARAALIRERGPRSRPALEAGLRLRDHYARTGAEDLMRDLDLDLGDALDGARTRDRAAAWGRTALALGADEETAQALVDLVSASPEESAGAADALAKLVGDRPVGEEIAALLRSAVDRAERMGAPLSGAVRDALARAPAAGGTQPEALLLEPSDARTEHPTLAVPPGAGDFSDLDLASSGARLEAPPVAPAEAESPELADAAPAPPEVSEPAGGPTDWVLFAWSMASADHGQPLLYDLAAQAAAYAVALEPDALGYLPVMALSLARIEEPAPALECLEHYTREAGSPGPIGWAVTAMIALDAQDAEAAEYALDAAVAAAENQPEDAPQGLAGLISELRERLEQLEAELGGADNLSDRSAGNGLVSGNDRAASGNGGTSTKANAVPGGNGAAGASSNAGAASADRGLASEAAAAAGNAGMADAGNGAVTDNAGATGHAAPSGGVSATANAPAAENRQKAKASPRPRRM
jgi:hypothetical protein